MLHEVFYWILNMSIIATAFGILVYFLRFIKGFPKLASYVLWGVVLLRLLCPIGISSEYSLLNLISKVSEKTYVKTIQIIDTDIDTDIDTEKDTVIDTDIDANKVTEKEAESGTQRFPQLTASNALQGAATYNPITYKTNILEGFFKVASVIWIIISVAAVIAMTALYYLTKAELKKATHLRDNIYEGTMVTTPTVYGMIKPKIVLPVGVEKEHLEYILAHEKVHIKRHDNIWRMLAILAACLHWFNPFSWLFLKCFLGDCEMACDAAAVKKMKAEERKNYARTLLTYATMDKTIFSSAFGSSKVKVRVKNILSYRKLTLFSTISFLGMVMVITFLLLTNAIG